MSNIDYGYNAEILSVGDIFSKGEFNIPIYQRLYVWQDLQIQTLWHDLHSAFLHSKDEIYYLGGIVVIENNGKYDLIDGQQRFTTLSLLRMALDDAVKNKLTFAIRDGVWDSIDKDNSGNADIQRMKRARRFFTTEIKKIENNNEFKDFINNKVQLNFITVPSTADLNKLFELINGRGEQLQQHEILKAKILSKVDDSRKNAFGKIWDMLVNMEEFLEVSIKNSLFKSDNDKKVNITWSDYFGDSYFNDKSNLNFCNLIEKIGSDTSSTTEGLSIKNIIKQDIIKSENTTIPYNDKEAESRYLSIISFSTFLLYGLVAFKKNDYFEITEGKNFQFKETNLIKIFDSFLDDDFCNEFIEFLFDFRLKFDNYIIKDKVAVGEKDNDTNHQISKITLKDKAKTVNKLEGYTDLALLQSMLYHSHTRQTQEWIIPFLNNINLRNDTLKVLKNIDNQLYSVINPEGTILERACNYPNNSSVKCNEVCNYLNVVPKDYHHFSRYWFYKMDWIIYCEGGGDDKKKNEENFKFTARNSIEHISPQNSDDENKEQDKVSENCLHCFGNLALVSISQNSSFSNNGFKEKMGSIEDKKIPNLKINMISQDESWGDENCMRHLDECLDLVLGYFNEK